MVGPVELTSETLLQKISRREGGSKKKFTLCTLCTGRYPKKFVKGEPGMTKILKVGRHLSPTNHQCLLSEKERENNSTGSIKRQGK